MVKVLLIGSHADELLKQVPKNEQCYISVNSNYDDSYDFAIVFERFDGKISVKAGKTVFISGEPDTIQNYSKKFIKQFDTIITTNRNILSSNKINKQYLPWHFGLYTEAYKCLEDYTNTSFPQKNKKPLLCGISSNKGMTSGHSDRLIFMNYAKCYFKDELDLYGRGIKDFTDKAQFLNKYKYQIVVENSQIKDYWTEKLADSFLAECFTFYYGCPNIKEYFPETSLIQIDINKPFEALKIIEDAINDNVYEKHIDDILISKNKTLKEYTWFKYVSKLSAINKKKHRILKSEIYLHNGIRGINLLKKIFINLLPHYISKKIKG